MEQTTFTATNSRVGIQGSIGNYGVINFNNVGADPEDTRRNILKKLYQSLEKNQKDLHPHRVPGTCEWFTSHPQYLDWKARETSAMLWVSADPGCGKSVLAKYLIDSIFLPTTTTCYFFFKDGFEGQGSATTALCCMLFQLFRAKPGLLSDAVVEHLEIAGKGFTDSFSELWETLLLVAQNQEAGEIVCVLDAIDECKDKSQLIRELHKLYRTETAFNLKFLVTSRPYREIRQGFQCLKFPGSAFLHINGEDEMDKISKEIDVFTEAKVNDIGDKIKLTDSERTFLLERFKHTPNRTYLWVHLTLDSIEHDIEVNVEITKRRMVEVTSELHLPRTLDEAYEGILSRSSNPEQAKRLLQIVVAAARPLTLDEMCMALTLNDGHHSYKDLDLIPEGRFRDDIRDLCGLFVTVLDSRIYLFHHTAKEFLVQKNLAADPEPSGSDLKWKHSIQLQESHRVLVDICIQNLLFTDLETHYLGKAVLIPEYLPGKIFLEYSATHWMTHLHGSQIEQEKTDLILKLCDTTTRRCLTWFRIYWANMVLYTTPTSGAFANINTDFPEDITTLMVASYFGLANVVKLILESDDSIDINSKDTKHERSALSWASGNGIAVVIRTLLKEPHRDDSWFPSKSEIHGDSMDNHQESNDNYTPLLRTIQEGHEAVVQLLLDKGAETEIKDKSGHTPLWRAADCGCEAVVNILVDRGANMEARDQRTNMTPLLKAAQNGHDKVVHLLVEKGAKIEAHDRSFRTPLLWAAQEGHEAVVRVLIAKGADKKAKDNISRYTPALWAMHNEHKAVFELLTDSNGHEPLLWAARNGYTAEVQRLVDNGADLEAKEDKNDRTALALATMNQYKSVIKILLDKGADTNTRDKSGRTLLSWTAEKGYEAIVRLLVDGGADIEGRDSDIYSYTPLLWAAQEGRESIVRFLLDRGANIEAKDGKQGRTALVWTAIYERGAMTQLLLDSGADIEAQDNSGLTSLFYASERGYESVVQPLLDKDANIEVKDKLGRSMLSRAATKGHEKVIRMLVDKGANIEERDNGNVNFGFTPLLWAAQEGRESVIRVLVDMGADIEVKDRRNRLTPLSWASRNGHEGIVRLLLDKGANIETKDKNGDTPLRLATGRGHQAVAQLLIDRGAQT
ncbi:hypothetical protein TWF706_011259 [Orbilia oligospora]|nr:hypothetical protein TWF706_011259 [Orbilia oligospora]